MFSFINFLNGNIVEIRVSWKRKLYRLNIINIKIVFQITKYWKKGSCKRQREEEGRTRTAPWAQVLILVITWILKLNISWAKLLS